MAWRGLALLLVAIAGLVAALRAPGLLLQVFVVASFGMLGVFVALLVVQRSNPKALDRWTPILTNRIRDLRRFAPVPRRVSADDTRRGRVDVVPWDEDDPLPVATVDEHAAARQLADKLAPPVGEVVDELGPLTPHEVIAELRREGEDLRSLGRLLRLDLTPYGSRISRALAAARARRFEECALALQVANERLRAEVQAALEKELPRVRSGLALRR